MLKTYAYRGVVSLKKLHCTALFPCISTQLNYRIHQRAYSVVINTDNQYGILSYLITPLWLVPYEEQLLRKQELVHEMLRKIQSKGFWNRRSTIRVRSVCPSPVVEEYRNKDEFSIRTGVDGNPKTVGLFVGTPASGSCICIPPSELINIREKHKEIVKLYQNYIRCSALPACHDLNDRGFWRNLVIRSNDNGDTMATIVVHPDGIEEDNMEEQRESIKAYFSEVEGGPSTLYFQESPHTRADNSQAPFKLLFGEPHLTETLGDYQFRISPDSFFQVNTSAAPLLYQFALDMASLSQTSTLLDICCGTGTVSILGSAKVRGCIGIEAIAQAVEDARSNATTNNVTNCEFVAGRVEDIQQIKRETGVRVIYLQDGAPPHYKTNVRDTLNCKEELDKVVEELNLANDIVAIVNPGRSGISTEVVKKLRECVQIERIVYIACKADNPVATENFRDLCNPDLSPAKPFILQSVKPVDMFPHTKHIELLLLFKR